MVTGRLIIEVRKPGMLTTVQDAGRQGYQKHGVIVSGAMDEFALRVANLLVGNAEREAVLEMTMIGPALHFRADALIAVCGGDLAPTREGVPVPQWQPVWVAAGSTLEWKQAKAGCRACLAIAGGLSVPQVMGSKSTFLRAKIGGFSGRALQGNDVLELGARTARQEERIERLRVKANGSPMLAEPVSPAWEIFPNYDLTPEVRVLLGREFERFDEESRRSFFQEAYAVTPQSDRMGYRLQGGALQLAKPFELISEAVSIGTIQVPQEGNPILLLADRQTTGGYPRIAQVITADLPLLAQVKPGGSVRFRQVTIGEAHAALLERERNLAKLRLALAL